MKLALAIFSSLMLATLVGCSKPSPEEQKKKEEELAASLAKSLGLPAPSGATTTTGAGATGAEATGGDGKILGQCVRKESNSCKEMTGALGLAEEEMCKGLEGTGIFTKGDKACPKENLVATCESTGGGQKVVTYYYVDKAATLASTREGAKLSCSFVDGKYVEAAAPAGAAPAAAGAAAKKAPAQPAAKKK